MTFDICLRHIHFPFHRFQWTSGYIHIWDYAISQVPPPRWIIIVTDGGIGWLVGWLVASVRRSAIP